MKYHRNQKVCSVFLLSKELENSETRTANAILHEVSPFRRVFRFVKMFPFYAFCFAFLSLVCEPFYDNISFSLLKLSFKHKLSLQSKIFRFKIRRITIWKSKVFKLSKVFKFFSSL